MNIAECGVYTLFSGSSGNCVYIKSGETEILIDAGMSARAIKAALNAIGTDISAIDAIFITHDHIDHVKALDVLMKKYDIPVHMTAETAEVCIHDTESGLARNAVLHTPEFTYDLKNMSILSFRTPHDSAMSVGYIIDTVGGKRIGLATDIGYVSDDMKRLMRGCSAVILEANYDEFMLMNGPYPYNLKKRIQSDRGHLSNAESAGFAVELAAAGVRDIMLAHLSKENNTPELAYGSVYMELSRCGFENSVNIVVADRSRPTKFI